MGMKGEKGVTGGDGDEGFSVSVTSFAHCVLFTPQVLLFSEY